MLRAMGGPGQKNLVQCHLYSLRLVSALKMWGNKEGKERTFPTFRLGTKCREIGKQGEDSLRFGSTLNVGKQGRQGEDFPYVSDLH